MNLYKKEYILFVGRFIPDKGLHYLIEAYQMIRNPKYKLVLIGGAPNPSNYEIQICNNKSENPIIIDNGLFISFFMDSALSPIEANFSFMINFS